MISTLECERFLREATLFAQIDQDARERSLFEPPASVKTAEYRHGSLNRESGQHIMPQTILSIGLPAWRHGTFEASGSLFDSVFARERCASLPRG